MNQERRALRVDYHITNGDAACLDMARVHAVTLELLLEDGAKRALEIVKRYHPDFASIPEYLAYADSFMLDRDAVKYDDKGNAILNLGAEEIDI